MNKIETPEESKLATEAYTQLGIPHFYKLDKHTYNRGEVADLGVKILKKMQMYEQLLTYERIKNENCEKEKADLKAQIAQLKTDYAVVENNLKG